MTLQEQIQATIQAYELACKPENLNYKYCWNNDLECGICKYSGMNNFFKLNLFLESRFRYRYLCTTPTNIEAKQSFFDDTKYLKKCNSILEAHQTRLKYLRKLLTNL